MPAIIVTGLGLGDEGKGAVVDYLARKHTATGVVLTNGGHQRAHNVVAPDGRHHTFHQFGSASFLPGVQTFHAPTAMVEPIAFFEECDTLVDIGVHAPWGGVMVHGDALIVTPFHIALNRIKERAQQHGSCGMGIGETGYDALTNPDLVLRARDLRDPRVVYDKLHTTQSRLRNRANNFLERFSGNSSDKLAMLSEYATLREYQAIKRTMEIYSSFSRLVSIVDDYRFDPYETWIFEGSQGVLLDEYSGFFPHVTRSKTAGQNAKLLLNGYGGNVRHVGVLRSFATRHGNGPLVTGDMAMDGDERFREEHNGLGEWQGAWRLGWTDFVAADYAARVAQPTELAITHMDRVRGPWKVCIGYGQKILTPPDYEFENHWEIDRELVLEQLNDAKPVYAEFSEMTPEALIEMFEAATSLPVTITSHGPSTGDFRSHDEALV